MTSFFKPVLWRLSELADVLGVDRPALDDNREVLITSVDVDPGRCEPGSLFVPARGISDGTQQKLIRSALTYGAVAALASQDTPRLSNGVPVLRVPELMPALRRLGDLSRKKSQACVIAVTGSVGKSTTKDMIRHALSHVGFTYATKGNYNGNVGFPAALASLPEEARFAILEMSAARKGAIAKRAKAASPAIGIVTNVGDSHGQFLKDKNAILEEKLSLLDHLDPAGTAILGRSVLEQDRDGPQILGKKRKFNIVTVGYSEDDDVYIKYVRQGVGSTVATLRVAGLDYSFLLPMPGAQFVQNAAFCVAAAHASGVDPSLALSSLASFESARGRAVRWRVAFQEPRRILEVIEDCQNSSPASVSALLGYLGGRKPKRKVLVFGDMLELGEREEQLHIDMAKHILKSEVDLLLTVGPRSKKVAMHLGSRVASRSYADVDGLVSDAGSLFEHGDLVALKGSAGVRLVQVLNYFLSPSSGASGKRASIYWSIEQAK